MSSEDEDRSSLDGAFGVCDQAQRQSKISYSREFLLSLSELECCKKLPSGFDASVLSEFEDGSHTLQDQRGSSPLLSYRRSEYGSSPPSRGDSANYSRGNYGRWDSRSSGHSDRDSDSQSDWGSDSGRRHGYPTRRSWHTSEHDGLLGSGSFPRPSGSASTISAPKSRANELNQLNRNNEPYHPPRPYKAVPHSRSGASDSRDEETFGSSDCSSEDRVEEERRRRASFEMMRKEHKRALEEKQKLNSEKPKLDYVSETSVLLENTKDEKRLLERNNMLDVAGTPAGSASDCGKSTILNQTSTLRPLVPPGFANTILEKNTALKPLFQTHGSEVVKPKQEEIAHLKPIHNGSLEKHPSQGNHSSDHQLDKTIQSHSLDEKNTSCTLSSGVSIAKLDKDHLLQPSSLSEVHVSLEDPDISKKVSGSEIHRESHKNHSTSILEKILGSILDVVEPIGSDEQIDCKPEDSWTPNSVQSSKFAHWFFEEERKPDDDISSGRPNDLLSLIVGPNKGRSQLPCDRDTPGNPLESSHNSTQHAKSLLSDIPSPINDISQRPNKESEREATPAVLTCEDLEQTILSEFIGKSSNLQPSLEGRSIVGEDPEQPREQVDNHASQNLLLLLQKGNSVNQMASSSHATLNEGVVSEAPDVHAISEENKKDNAKGINTSGNPLTLEALFGKAFMQELQSIEAPVSVQRGPVDSASDKTGSNGTIYQNDLLPANNKEENRLENMENWLGFGNPQFELNSFRHQTEVITKHKGIDAPVKFQRPKEESLATLNGLLNPQNAIPAGTSANGELPSNLPVDIVKKLAATGTIIKEDQAPVGPGGSPIVQTPYGRMETEIPHHNLSQTSSLQFHPPQTGHGGPLFFHSDAHPAHTNPLMKFVGPEGMIHRDPSSSLQFPANMMTPPFPRQTTTVPGYDLPAHHAMLSQMQIPGSYPSHLSHDFHQRYVHPHPGNQGTSLMPELNPKGFLLGPHRQGVGGLGMPVPAPDINSGSNHPEAFQRLLEMELRAKSKQLHPLSLGHTQGMYSHELEMGFRNR